MILVFEENSAHNKIFLMSFPEVNQHSDFTAYVLLKSEVSRCKVLNSVLAKAFCSECTANFGKTNEKFYFTSTQTYFCDFKTD